MHEDLKFDLDEMNHSELVKICHWMGMRNITRGVPRDVIIQSLTHGDRITVPNPVDEERKELSNWMKRHWSVIEMQVPKSECPDCYLCDDAQVVDCFGENKRHFKP